MSIFDLDTDVLQVVGRTEAISKNNYQQVAPNRPVSKDSFSDGSIEYRCRDNSGYINFVLGEDAVELNTSASEPYTPKLKFGKDRFDLEHEMMQCWAVVDDIDLLYKYFGDDEFFTGMKGHHADKIMNLMGGLKDLYDIKFQRMFDTFGQCIKNKEL